MFKQVVVLRTDLGMGKGKLVAQAGHAFLEAYKKADGKTVKEWEATGCEKVAVRVSGEKELLALRDEARRLKLPNALVRDAGHTQIPAGSITALAIGPAKEEEVDRITGDLKLL
ncbi:aminoacyl-tRNA hydrolase [Candidatus Micrarchaeota archaeon CG_4_10_14_0_2_um_filter_55_9]|nr:MAG: aminoacyl-tRNA hydrolase [Candidatus Micrarchaeota archaeon CG1_02_55_41]PIZ91711.1 MAG: aminoacyl-tRNA hydrolase [Candidatus Micrarchaeota archaeon CG_4_10_14_0_2_um_filter_55_9]